VVLLQDGTQHIGEAIDGCRKALTMMFQPATQSIQDESMYSHLIELNLFAGANFALGWVRKWHSKLNFNTMSQGLPPP
jgi:hypothetical protein